MRDKVKLEEVGCRTKLYDTTLQFLQVHFRDFVDVRRTRTNVRRLQLTLSSWPKKKGLKDWLNIFILNSFWLT